MLALQAVCLVALVLQNALAVILSRYSRYSIPRDQQFHSLSTLVSQEGLKYLFFFCLFTYSILSSGGSGRKLQQEGREEKRMDEADVVITIIEETKEDKKVWGAPLRQRCTVQHILHMTRVVLRQYKQVMLQKSTLLMGIPAALYTFQGFIFFYALSRIDPLTFQILAQSRVLFTAILSVLVLNRALSRGQCLCLVFLVLGTILTQVPDDVLRSSSPFDGEKKGHPEAWLGCLACLVQSLSSSFAGVYMEKQMKGSKATLAEKSLQLGLFAWPFAFLSMFVLQVLPNWREQREKDGRTYMRIFQRPDPAEMVGRSVRPFYFFEGYHLPITIAVITCQFAGGVVITLIMRYSSNIAKVFATSVSVLVCGVLSWLIWGTVPGFLFILGGAIVTGSTIRYSLIS